MTPYRLHALVGFLLLIAGIAFDFFLVAPSVTRAYKPDATLYLSSFTRYMHELIKTYMLILGLANLVFSVLAARAGTSGRLDWAGCLLIVGGSVTLIVTSFWYASAGPSFHWETRCTVLTAALAALLLGLGLDLYRVTCWKP